MPMLLAAIAAASVRRAGSAARACSLAITSLPRCPLIDVPPRTHWHAAYIIGTATPLPSRPTFLPRLREQRSFRLSTNAGRDFDGRVGAGGIAAAVSEAKIVEHLLAAVHRVQDMLDLGSLLVTVRQVEAHAPAAAGAIV